jgi:hypothetical protein
MGQSYFYSGKTVPFPGLDFISNPYFLKLCEYIFDPTDGLHIADPIAVKGLTSTSWVMTNRLSFTWTPRIELFRAWAVSYIDRFHISGTSVEQIGWKVLDIRIDKKKSGKEEAQDKDYEQKLPPGFPCK